MEERAEYISVFVSGVVFCMAVWLLFAQCGRLAETFGPTGLRSLEVMYVRSMDF